MTKHTPGPWRAKLEGDRCLGIVPDYHNHPPTEGCWDGNNYDCPATTDIVTTDSGYYAPRAADALLIAAAPDLLASCKELRDALACAIRIIAASDQDGLTERFVEQLAALGIKNGIGVRAEDAITKAEEA